MNGEAGKTRDKVAEAVGMSGKTYEKAKAVSEAAKARPQRPAGLTDVPVRVITGLDDAAILLRAERDENTCRKDFTPGEAVGLAEALEKLEGKAAKARQAAAGPKEGRGKKSGSSNLDEPVANGRTDQRVAEAVGMKKDTYRKAKAVSEAAKAPNFSGSDLLAKMDETGKVGSSLRLAVNNRSLSATLLWWLTGSGSGKLPEPIANGSTRSQPATMGLGSDIGLAVNDAQPAGRSAVPTRP